MKQKKIDWICVLILLFSIGSCLLIWKIGTDVLIAELEEEIQEENIDNEIVIEEEIEICEVGYEELLPVFELSDEDRWNIECIVAGEAKGESLLGKMAVAQCIRNAMIKNEYSANEVRINYKYSGWDEDLESKNPEMWEEVKHAVWCVFDNGESVSTNPILFFYAPKRAAGRWHNTLEFDSEIGGHRFFYLAEDINADWFVNIDFDT